MNSIYLKNSLKFFFISIVFFINLNSCVKTKETFDIEDMQTWETFNKSSGLASNYVKCIIEDKSGNIWVGTSGGGISKYSGESWNTYSTSSGQLINDTINAIFQDSYGDIWVGTNAGLSFYYNNGSGYVWGYSSYFNGLHISTFCQTSGGDVLVGTQGWGFFYWGGETFLQEFDSDCGYCNFINTMYKDNSGNVWFGTYAGLKKYTGDFRADYRLYTITDGLPVNDINAIKEDSWGNIWFGGYGGEKVAKYSGGNFELISLYNDNYTYIMSIEEDSYGNVWFGGLEIGAIKYDGTIMKSYFEVDGLPGNTIIDILSDSKGDIWFGTLGNGIGRYKSYINK